MKQSSKGRAQRVTRLRATYVVSESASRAMRSNRAKDTKIEVAFRKSLWRAGLRGYRKNFRPLPGTPDVVYTRARVAVFLHGCYWHRCPRCEPPLPKTNARFWQAKFEYNVQRDKENAAALARRGYRVITIWECQLRSQEELAVSRVRAALSDQRHRLGSKASNGVTASGARRRRP